MGLNVLYDVSTIGFGQYEQTGRTGIYRVVDCLLHALLEEPGLDISLTAVESLPMLAYARRHCHSEPRLRDLSFVAPSGGGALYQRLLELKETLRLRADNLALAERAVRRFLSEGLQRWERTFPASALDLSQFADRETIFYSPYWALPKTVSPNRRLKRFLHVHDILPLSRPHEVGTDGGRFLRGILDSAGPEDWVVCVSEFTRQEVLEHHPVLIPQQVVVVPSAASSLFLPCTDATLLARIRQKYSLGGRPYLLSVATLERRKNLEGLLSAFADYVAQAKDNDTSLVLVGAKSNSTERLLEIARQRKVPPKQFVLTGYVPDEDLSPLYSDARAFLYPSFWEGFGLPPLEAMQCGVPVLVSNTSSLPEVVGDAGLLLNPNHLAGWSEAFSQILSDPALRQRLAKNSLARARHFSWAGSARLLSAHFAAALGGQGQAVSQPPSQLLSSSVSS